MFVIIFQLNQAQQQKKSMFENVEYEWNLSDDNFTDMSDDEEIIKVRYLCTHTLLLSLIGYKVVHVSQNA